MKKCLTLKEVVAEELKDKEFKRYYEGEGRRLAIGYKIEKRAKVVANQRLHRTSSYGKALKERPWLNG